MNFNFGWTIPLGLVVFIWSWLVLKHVFHQCLQGDENDDADEKVYAEVSPL